MISAQSIAANADSRICIRGCHFMHVAARAPSDDGFVTSRGVASHYCIRPLIQGRPNSKNAHPPPPNTAAMAAR